MYTKVNIKHNDKIAIFYSARGLHTECTIIYMHIFHFFLLCVSSNFDLNTSQYLHA